MCNVFHSGIVILRDPRNHTHGKSGLGYKWSTAKTICDCVGILKLDILFVFNIIL